VGAPQPLIESHRARKQAAPKTLSHRSKHHGLTRPGASQAPASPATQWTLCSATHAQLGSDAGPKLKRTDVLRAVEVSVLAGWEVLEVEFNLLTRGEVAVAVHLDICEVNPDLARHIGRGQHAPALLVAKAPNSAVRHRSSLTGPR
jgi:hypothetical protein